MAERLGAGRRRRDPAASRHHRAELHPRSRHRQHQRHRGPGPVAGYPAGVIALRKTGRRRARRLADRHRRLRHRGAASDPDVRAARQSRPGSPGLRQARLGAVRAGRQASREDARTDQRSRTDFDAQRCIRRRIAGADGRDRQSAADLGGAGGQARRDLAVVGLHRAGRRRPHRRSGGSPDRGGRQGGELDRRAGGVAVGRRRQDPGDAAGRTDHGFRRCRPPKRCCATPAISSRAGPARSRST